MTRAGPCPRLPTTLRRAARRRRRWPASAAAFVAGTRAARPAARSGRLATGPTPRRDLRTGAAWSPRDSCDDLLALVRRARRSTGSAPRAGTDLQRTTSLRGRRRRAGRRRRLAPRRPSAVSDVDQRRDRHQRPGGRRRRARRGQDRRPPLFRVDGDTLTYDVHGRDAEAARARSTCPATAAAPRAPAVRRPASWCSAPPCRPRRRRQPARADHRVLTVDVSDPAATRGRPPASTTAAWSPRGCTTAWSGWCSGPGCPTSTSSQPDDHPPSARPPARTGRSSATAPSRTGCPTRPPTAPAEPSRSLDCDQVAVPDDDAGARHHRRRRLRRLRHPRHPSVSGLADSTPTWPTLGRPALPRDHAEPRARRAALLAMPIDGAPGLRRRAP